MQIPRTAVVAEPLPEGQNFGFIRRGKFMDRGKALHPSLEVGHDRCNRRLLEHHFADQNRVRIPRLPPRQVASVPPEPGAQALAELFAVHGPIRPKQAAQTKPNLLDDMRSNDYTLPITRCRRFAPTPLS